MSSLLRFSIIILLVFVILGLRFLQFSLPKNSKDNFGFYNDKDEVTFIGHVVEPVLVKRGKQNLVVGDLAFLGSNDTKGNSVKGKVLLFANLYPRFKFNDWLIITGKPQTPPVFNEFSYKDYLEIDGIYSLMNFPNIKNYQKLSSTATSFNLLSSFNRLSSQILAVIYDFRDRIETIINASLPEPHASLLAGILFGVERNFDPAFYTKMQNVGILHVIVASGYNISVVVGSILIFSFLLGRRLTCLFYFFGMAIYAVITGLQPPILRACLMVGGSFLAELLGRQRLSLLWLFISGAGLLFWNPFWIKSLSFQLSFLAALAIIVVLPFLTNLISKLLVGPSLNQNQKESFLKVRLRSILMDQKSHKMKKSTLIEILLTTISVQVLTMPIIFFNFQKMAWASFLVNPLVLWIIPLVMGLGALMVGLGFFSSGLAYLVGILVWLPLEYFIRVVRFFG